MKQLNMILTAAAVMAGAWSGTASAQQAGPAQPAARQAPAPAAMPGPFATQAVTENTLQESAGREDTNQLAQADLRAGVSQNSVGNNSVTGAARIEGNAFQNMSGLSILNVNTGNNVAINAAMNVNVSLSPAP